MDYKFTFEDGSEAFAHSGVKGMKWGVWNEDTKARYSSGAGHRSIMRADRKVDAASANYQQAVKSGGKNSYGARAAQKKLNTAVEKREFRVEKNRPGEGKISPDRYNELRSNQRVKRAAITGGVLLGPWGAAIGTLYSTSSSNLGKRAVSDLLKGRETYRVNKKTGEYENVSPFASEYNRNANTNPVYVKSSSRR